MGELKGTALLEAVVASVLFLTVFAVTLELIPRLAVRDDDALRVAEADYRMMRAFEKYASGVWPEGSYVENYAWGTVSIRVCEYRSAEQVQSVEVSAEIEGSRRRTVFRQLVEKKR